MKKSSFFTASLASGAAASLAVGCLMPDSKPAINDKASGVDLTATTEQPILNEILDGASTTKSISIKVTSIPTEWSKAMEREFRALALEEAQGSISPEKNMRLKTLDNWRERLVLPRSADEILFQLRRDHHLDKMSETFGKYVQFKQASNRKGFSAS
jgi:hypothetical protein